MTSRHRQDAQWQEDGARRGHCGSRDTRREQDEAPVEAWDAIAHQYATHVADGEVDLAVAALRLAGLRFDVTGSQYGVMLVPDQVSALREMVRVPRPGGRVFLTAYGDLSRFEALGFFVSALQAVVPAFEGPSEDEPMLAFQVADPEVLRQRFIAAGLADVTVNTSHQERVQFRSGQQVWDWCLGSNPVPDLLVADLAEHQRADVIAVLDGMVRERADQHCNAILTAPLDIGVGTKPWLPPGQAEPQRPAVVCADRRCCRTSEQGHWSPGGQ